jgi:hypothetical protein
MPHPRVRTAFNTLFSETIYPGRRRTDIRTYFEIVKPKIFERVHRYFQHEQTGDPCRFRIVLKCSFHRNVTGKDEFCEAYFGTYFYNVFLEDNIAHGISELVENIIEQIDNYVNRGSNWVFKAVDWCELKVGKYRPIRAGCFVPTPVWIKNKSAVVNVKSRDNMCFVWAILAFLYPQATNPNRVVKYRPYLSTLNLKGLLFPMTMKSIPKFENQNNLAVNVFEPKGKGLRILYISSKPASVQTVNLLLLTNKEKTIYHFTCVKDISHLLGRRNCHRCFYCLRCFQKFRTEKKLKEHSEYCQKLEAKVTRYGNKKLNNILCFANFYKMERPLFFLVADFECKQKKTNKIGTANCSYLNELELLSFSYMRVDVPNKFYHHPVSYCGKDAIDKFLGSIINEERIMLSQYNRYVKLHMTPQDEKKFQLATHCCICNRPFTRDQIKCRDHDHNKNVFHFRGASHNFCNLQRRTTPKLYCYFHNLSRFDLKYLVRALGSYKDRQLSVIPKTGQNFIMLRFGSTIFIDSYNFMSSSLEVLVKSLLTGGEDFFHPLKTIFNTDKIDDLLAKLPFPYDFITDDTALEVTSVPPIESFYNKLTMSGPSQEEYERVLRIWDLFQMRTMRQLLLFYNELDTALLAICIVQFGDMLYSIYELEMSHYYSLPGYAWDAMLKSTDIKLQLLTDSVMYMFFEQNIRAGLSYIGDRYFECNNETLGDRFDPNKPVKHLLLVDFNALYSFCLSQPLPFGCFQWLSDNEINALNIKETDCDGEVGYVLECDLEVPDCLHDFFNYYPPMEEKMMITPDMYSPYTKRLLEVSNIKPSKAVKLVATLFPKYKYVCHMKNLQLYMSLGVILKKVHRVVSFKQSRWMANFIEQNIEQRIRAGSNKFLSDCFKLLNNAIYGYSFLNKRDQINVELVNDKEKAMRKMSNPRLKNFDIYERDLVSFETGKDLVQLDMPVYIAFCTLQYAKFCMCNYYYNHLKKLFPKDGSLKVLASDTDSFCIGVEISSTKSLYEKLKSQAEWYDFSNYDRSHPLFDDSRKGALGLLKNELAACTPYAFVGLSAKMYSIGCYGKDYSRAKGIPRYLMPEITFEDYKRCLMDLEIREIEYNHIVAEKQHLYIKKQKKRGLVNFYDKRYCLPNHTTLPFGHYKTLDNGSGGMSSGENENEPNAVDLDKATFAT